METQRRNRCTAAPQAHPEVRRARRRSRRRSAAHERPHGALLLVPGQQGSAPANPAREGARRPQGLDRPVPERDPRTRSGSSRARRAEAGAQGEDERELEYLRLSGPRAGGERGQLPRCDGKGDAASLAVRRSTCRGAGRATRAKRRFRVARSEGSYFGRIRFRRQSQPYMTISVAESRPGRGVVVAEVDLRFVSDVISQTRVGSAGYAYAINSRGAARSRIRTRTSC